jgi:hypothetical protein
MASYLRDHHDKVIGRWAGLVAEAVGDRLSPGEVRNEVEDLYAQPAAWPARRWR